MDLPADVETYARVEVNEDRKWETEFLPWIEDLEKKGVGVEDGFFVASFNNRIRKVKEESIDPKFLQTCLSGLDKVAIQRLQQFDNRLIMHYGTHTLTDKEKLEEFKAQAVDSAQYEKDTCCTTILKEKGIRGLMSHLDSQMHAIKTKRCSARPSGWATSNRVIAEELGYKFNRKYLQFKDSTEKFQWELDKPLPPKLCEEPECGMNSDTQESGSSSSEEETDATDEVPQIKRRKTNDSGRLELPDNPFYGFGQSDNIDKDLNVTENFCMKRIFNLLWLYPYYIPGFHSSYFFYGTSHSFFPVHTEDALTLSMNYLYCGNFKAWVMIPPWATDLLEFHLKNCGSFLSYMHCSNFMGHKALAPTVQSLLDFQIPFKIVLQRPGDLVILYPNTAHFGFNLGRNIAEAINFAIPSWVPWGGLAKKCSCLKFIHIPMKPFFAALRPDLLEDLENGRPITTPQSVRGLQFLASKIQETSKMHCKTFKPDGPAPMTNERRKGQTKKKEVYAGQSTSCVIKNEDKKKCPLKKCSFQSEGRKDMLKHVTSAHPPLKSDPVFLQKINVLFLKS